MKNSKKEGKKLNNKGFSLVELIVVIAIMAIITAALAPQFIKYVGRSRAATDEQNLDLIISTTQIVLAEESVTPAAGTFTINGSSSNFSGMSVATGFQTAFENAVGKKYPTVKTDKTSQFQITVDVATGDGWTVTGTY